MLKQLQENGSRTKVRGIPTFQMFKYEQPEHFTVADWLDGGAYGDPALAKSLGLQINAARVNKAGRAAAAGNYEEASIINDMSNSDYFRGYMDDMQWMQTSQDTLQMAQEGVLFDHYALQESTNEQFRGEEKSDFVEEKTDYGQSYEFREGNQIEMVNRKTDLEAARKGIMDPVVNKIDQIAATQEELWSKVETIAVKYGADTFENSRTLDVGGHLVGEFDRIKTDPLATLDLGKTSNAELKQALDLVRQQNFEDLGEDFKTLVDSVMAEDEKMDYVTEEYNFAHNTLRDWAKTAQNLIRTGQIPEENVEEVQQMIDQAAPQKTHVEWSTTNTDRALENTGADGVLQDVQNSYDIFGEQKWGKYWDPAMNLGEVDDPILRG